MKRFDDLIALWERGEAINFADKIRDYNKRTSKWSFFEYLREELKTGVVKDRTAVEICLYWIREQEE